MNPFIGQLDRQKNRLRLLAFRLRHVGGQLAIGKDWLEASEPLSTVDHRDRDHIVATSGRA